MASAEIGGDSSVEWMIEVDHVRQDPLPTSVPCGPAGWQQHGIDEAGFDQNFTITLLVPEARDILVDSLYRAWEAAKGARAGDRVKVFLPIEPKKPNQIKVEWESAEVSADDPNPSIKYAAWLRKQAADIASADRKV
jgi:hypothetical protein